MKRYRIPLAILAAALVFSLIFVIVLKLTNQGGEGKTPPTAPQSFETDLTVVLNESRILAHYKQQSLGYGEVSILSPEYLDGLLLRFEGAQCSIQYKGLRFGTDFSKFPESAFGTALMETLGKQLDGAEIVKNQKDGKWHYEGNAQAGDFLLVQDAQSGFYEYLSIPAIDLTIEFTNFHMTNGNQ